MRDTRSAPESSIGPGTPGPIAVSVGHRAIQPRRRLWILDEIQRFPDPFSMLRVLADRFGALWVRRGFPRSSLAEWGSPGVC